MFIQVKTYPNNFIFYMQTSFQYSRKKNHQASRPYKVRDIQSIFSNQKDQVKEMKETCWIDFEILMN